MRRATRSVFALLTSVVLAGCADFHPQPLVEVGFLDRAATETQDDVLVTVAIPTADENTQIFGADVVVEGVEPVWVRVDNHGDDEYYLFPATTDPDYFSAHEASWRVHRTLRGNVNEQLDTLSASNAISLYIAPHSSQEGFIQIDLRRPDAIKRFDFLIDVPGLEALPCCDLGGDEETPGDPLNIVISADSERCFSPSSSRAGT